MTSQTHVQAHGHTNSTQRGGVRPAKSVLALVHLAAGGQGAAADCFLVRLVLQFQLRERPALQEKNILL